MPTATHKKQLAEMAKEVATLKRREPPILAQLRSNPALFMESMGQKPDPWQKELLTTYLPTTSRRSSVERTLLLCSRQAGKSTVAAALAMETALLDAPALVLLLSPSQRQSAELYRKCADANRAIGRPVPAVAESALRVEFANGSRIISLPGKDDGAIRGFSAPKLVIIDEASRVPDSLFFSIRPMLSVSRGKLLALSTPAGRRGWFWEAHRSEERWHRVRVTADQISRITPEFLADERASLGEAWYKQEYFCEFRDLIGSCFRQEDIDAALTATVAPLFGSEAT
jgi:hypothetical protein